MPKRYSGKRKHARKLAEKSRLKATKNAHDVQFHAQENLPKGEIITRGEISSKGKNLPRAEQLRLPSETNNVAGASDHIDHQFREDMRLRAPLLQQPVSDDYATSSAESAGMVATVQNTLKEVKDKVLENGHHLVQGINNKLGVFHNNSDNIDNSNSNNNDKNDSNNEESTSGIGAKVAEWKEAAQEKLLQVKDKIVETGSSIVDKFSKSEHDNNENNKDQLSNEDKNLKESSPKQTESQKPLDSDPTLQGNADHSDSTVDFQKPRKDIIEKTFGHKDAQPKDSDSSTVLNSDHIDHKFREEFRLQQPLLQQPLDVTDQPTPHRAPSHNKEHQEQPTEQQSSESSSASIKDKVSSTFQNITDTVSNILPKDTVNTVLTTAKEQVANVVHFVQERANESMRHNEEEKNENNENNNNTLKNNVIEKSRDKKERVSSGLNNAVDKMKETKDDVTQKKNNKKNKKLNNQNNKKNISSQGLDKLNNKENLLSEQQSTNENNLPLQQQSDNRND